MIHISFQTQSGYSLEAYANYITVERRAKYPNLLIVSSIYERAIAEAAKRRFSGEEGAEQVLRMFWTGYCDALVSFCSIACINVAYKTPQRILDAEWGAQLAVLKRATRSVPGSGEVWARYIRLLVWIHTSFLSLRLSDLNQERLKGLDVEEDIEAVEGANTFRVPVYHIDLEYISDIFNRAFDTKMIQQDVDQIVAMVLSRAGYERRRLEAGIDRMDHFFFVMHVLMESD